MSSGVQRQAKKVKVKARAQCLYTEYIQYSEMEKSTTFVLVRLLTCDPDSFSYLNILVLVK